MSQIKTTEIEGDVAIGRHVTAGGNATIQGNTTVKKNLKVEGWLDARNIKGPNKGIFLDVTKLREAYPLPHDGWWALVGNTLPAPLYIADGGAWVATGESAGNPTIDSQQYNEAVAQLDSDLKVVAADVSANKQSIEQIRTQINTIGGSVNSLTSAVSGLNTRMSNAESAIESVRDGVSSNSVEIESNSVEIESNKGAIEVLEGRVDRHDEGLSNLQMNVQAVDEKADAAKTAAQGAQGALKPLNDRIIALGNTVSGHTTAISNLTEIVDEQETDIQGCYGLIGRNDAKIHSIGIVPFDGLYDADNVPATGVWFRRYGADEGGTCVMWSADGKFPVGFSEQDYNFTFHGVTYIRTDRVFRLENRLYRFDGNGLVEVGRDPRQVFNDMWDAAFGEYGKYDPANAPDAEHPYLGNGIWMSYEEAQRVWLYRSVWPYVPNYNGANIPTNVPFFNASGQNRIYAQYCAIGGNVLDGSGIKVWNIGGNVNYPRIFPDTFNLESWNPLRKIIGVFTIALNHAPGCWASSTIEDFRWKGINRSLHLFSYAPNLTFESVSFAINYASNTSAITITVNPAVYAKLTGDTTNAAAAALTDEEAAAWQGLVTAAAAKNISFATV